MRILLVHPRFPVTYWSFDRSLEIIGRKASLPPLGLITVAACLPADWEYRLVDINVNELAAADLAWADVVLTGGMLVQLPSLLEVVAQAKAAGRRVVVGGPMTAAAGDQIAEVADVVFHGEIEGRESSIIEAIRAEGHVVLRSNSLPSIDAVPVPRYSLVDFRPYQSMAIQYSRGCPFHCEFCDVVELFGRKPRVKSNAQVLAELDEIAKTGFRGTVFFVDDNFIGNRRKVRELLPALIEWQREHGHPFEFYTEASVDLASDPALVEAMVEAGFRSAFLGIETPSVEALASAGKKQNLRINLSEAIDTLTKAGLEVMGGFIVGFDTDGPEVFEAQKKFIQESAIPLAMVGMLTALPGTQLHSRLRREGRLRREATGDQFSRPNFTPVMDERVLLEGYASLMAYLYSADAYYDRCARYVERAAAPPGGFKPNTTDLLHFARGMFKVGVRSPRRRHFWRLLVDTLRRHPAQTKWVVVHAIMGEHLIEYTEQHVIPMVKRGLASLEVEESNMIEERARMRARKRLPTVTSEKSTSCVA